MSDYEGKNKIGTKVLKSARMMSARSTKYQSDSNSISSMPETNAKARRPCGYWTVWHLIVG